MTDNFWIRLLNRVPQDVTLGAVLFVAFLAFEIFTLDTNLYALQNLVGVVDTDLISWPTILAVAFTAIDLVGLGYLLTPRPVNQTPRPEARYLAGVWLLAASICAVLTWWAISLRLLAVPPTTNTIVSQEQLLRVVPTAVAVVVWLFRILLVAIFALASTRLFLVPQTAEGSAEQLVLRRSQSTRSRA